MGRSGPPMIPYGSTPVLLGLEPRNRGLASFDGLTETRLLPSGGHGW